MIRNYLFNAFPLCILQLEKEEIYSPFILRNYLQPVLIPQWKWFDYNSFEYSCSPFFTYNRLSADMVWANNINVLTFFMNALNDGYYIDIAPDIYYTPGKWLYHKEHRFHLFIIYGYNSEKDCFLSLTYTDSWQYELLEIKSSILARTCSTDYFEYVAILKRDKSNVIIYDIEELKYLFSQYIISGKKHKDFFCRYRHRLETKLYDIDVMDWMVEYVQTNKKHSTTMVYTFYEQKSFMSWALEYVAKRENVMTSELQDKIDFLKNESRVALNLFLKYKITKSVIYKERTANKFKKLNETEIKGIKLLLKSLRNIIS